MVRSDLSWRRRASLLDSRALCRALFDVYLGEHPVSSDAKTRVIAECPDLLAAGSESLPD